MESMDINVRVPDVQWFKLKHPFLGKVCESQCGGTKNKWVS